VSYRRRALSPFASGERNLVPENCIFLGYFAASSGNSLPTFRNKLLVPSSRVKNLRSLLIYFTAEASNYNYSTLWIENLVKSRATLENWVDSRASLGNWADSKANLENNIPARFWKQTAISPSSVPYSSIHHMYWAVRLLVSSFLPSCVVLIHVFNSKTFYCRCSVFPNIIIL
jgi:hypothetical protein